MTEHEWFQIDPVDEPSWVCNVCLNCKCCGTYPKECPGEWTPEDD